MTVSRLLAGVKPDAAPCYERHFEIHGPPGPAGPELVDRLERAGLRGRGGAGFPTAAKLRAVMAARGRSRSVLVNAVESEPMSAKDRLLLQFAPHLVLDGALAAADTIGADAVVLAVPENAAPTRAALERAVFERPTDRRLRIEPVPAAHLAGEETALIRYLDGGPLLPTLVPPRPAERGLRRRPTLVQNPETLAHLALIARHGSGWFRGVGTPEHPGSALVTVTGAVEWPGVLEIACGTALETVLERAGGSLETVRAVLVGGYHGTWLGPDAVASVTLDDVALAEHGATLAAGVLVVLGASTCGVREIAGVLTWLAGESAGQCGPCRHGLPALAGLVTAIADGRAPRGARALLERWSDQLPGRGACRLPDGAVRFLQSGLGVFAEEFRHHERHGPCPACRRAATLRVPEAYRWAA